MNQKILQEKSAVVNEIKQRLETSSSLLIVGYQGSSVSTIEELRNILKDNGVSYSVYKNTLVTRALKEANLEIPHELSGPNAYIFTHGEDLAKGIRLVSKFAEKHNKIVLGDGLVGKKYTDAATMAILAKLPDRNGLISMFLSCLQTPIRKFAATVKALSESKA